MLLLTHCWLMSKRGRYRSLRWNYFWSASDSTRSAGTGTSRPRLAFLPGTSGLRLMMGGSWVSRRSANRRDRHSDTRSLCGA